MSDQVGTIARIHVSQGPTDSWPIAERVRGGWQSGVMFYPDRDVKGITTTYLRRCDMNIVEANAEDLLTLPYGSILRTASESKYEPGTVWHWDGERLAEMCFSDMGANIRVTDRDIYEHDDGEELVTLAEILPLPMTLLWTGDACDGRS